MQSALEKYAIEEREKIVKSDYSKENPYSDKHKNAQSDKDNKGKGTNHGGHTHFLPDSTKKGIDYSNFDTSNGGSKDDIEGRNDIGGRNKAMASSLYNKEHPYGSNLINTEENKNLGQYFN